ncbi:glycosyltransferase [Nostocoides australiense]
MAIIPAHNEEDGIEKTIGSLLRQEPAPSVVLVMADNCTDETIPRARARAAGAEVIETVGNTAKKAGAQPRAGTRTTAAVRRRLRPGRGCRR